MAKKHGKLAWVVTADDMDIEINWIKSEINRLGLEKLKKLSNSGKVYFGNNVERASYSETDHAEESAIIKPLFLFFDKYL